MDSFSQIRSIVWRTIAEFLGITEPTDVLTGATAKTYLRGDATWSTLPHSLSDSYVSGTGTAGTDNNAQGVVTVAIAANTLTQVGDYLRVRSHWKGTTGSNITGSITVNGVSAATTTDSGAATMQVTDTWLFYIDATHANIIAMAAGALDTSISNNNVAGFAWASSQDAIISQDAALNNHIVVYSLNVDVYPKGTA